MSVVVINILPTLTRMVNSVNNLSMVAISDDNTEYSVYLSVCPQLITPLALLFGSHLLVLLLHVLDALFYEMVLVVDYYILMSLLPRMSSLQLP